MKNKTDVQLINEQIKAFKVKVISEEGENLGIMARDAALTLARQKELDLVMLSDKDEVPLVKIMDFGKNLYTKKKKLAEAEVKKKPSAASAPTLQQHPIIQKSNLAPTIPTAPAPASANPPSENSGAAGATNVDSSASSSQ